MTGPGVAPPRRGRGPQGTFGDMIRTLLVLGVVVFGIVFFAKDRQDHTPVKRVDDQLSLTVTQARRVSPYPLLAPVGLASAWAPTSVSFDASPIVGGHQLLHIGYVTPAGKFADLEESDRDVTAALAPESGKHLKTLGTLPDGSRTATILQSSTGVITLTEVVGNVHLGVTGGAGQAELTTLLSALR